MNSPASAPEIPRNKQALLPKSAAYAAVGVIVVLVSLVRFHVRDIPLERDEGEYAYVGQLMLQGVPPYKLAYNMKLPGTYAAYAAILGIFGQSTRGIHEGLLLVNAANMLLVWLLGRRLFGDVAALVSAAAYGLLAVSPSVLGFAGHATHFVLLFALAGLVFLDSAKPGHILISGLMFGLAFLMKQPGILFAIFAVLYLVVSRRSEKQLAETLRIAATFLAGFALPLAVTCLWLWRAGVFQSFWFWTFRYASQYASAVRLPKGLHIFGVMLPRVIGPSWMLWALAGVGLGGIIRDVSVREQARFVAGLFLFSFLAVCPGLYFREHYFILMLPAVALLTGAAVASAIKMLPQGQLRMLPVLLFVLCCGIAVWRQRGFLFTRDPIAACRSVYGINPFPEAVKIADYIRSHSAPDTTVAVLGSEPEIFFDSGRRSATGYIYTYSLVEQQAFARQMQRDMAREIEAARPQFIVYIGVPSSWLPQPGADRFIFDWSRQYLHDHYFLDGMIELLPQTEYHWGEDAKHFQRRSPWAVELYRRVN